MAALCVPLADGVEEMEAVIIIDILRRAGLTVTSFAVGGSMSVTGARGVKVIADREWAEIDPGAVGGIVIPGGAAGAKTLAASPGIREVVRRCNQEHLLTGAICAGPRVLHAAGILQGRTITCYPGVEKDIPEADCRADRVVRDGNIITGRGPGTAVDFALALVDFLCGEPTAGTVRRGLALLP